MLLRSGCVLHVGFVAGLTMLMAASASEAAPGRRRHPGHAVARAPSTQASPLSGLPAPPNHDNLYKERGYGYGGTVFDLRTGGGPALGGTCTSVADTPPSCRRGGVYGNGFIYGFGSP